MKITRFFCVIFTFFFLLPSHLYPMSFLADKIQNTVHGSVEAAYNLSGSLFALSSTVIERLPDPIEFAAKMWAPAPRQREEEKKSGIGATIVDAGKLVAYAGLVVTGAVVVTIGAGVYVVYQLSKDKTTHPAKEKKEIAQESQNGASINANVIDPAFGKKCPGCGTGLLPHIPNNLLEGLVCEGPNEHHNHVGCGTGLLPDNHNNLLGGCVVCGGPDGNGKHFGCGTSQTYNKNDGQNKNYKDYCYSECYENIKYNHMMSMADLPAAAGLIVTGVFGTAVTPIVAPGMVVGGAIIAGIGIVQGIKAIKDILKERNKEKQYQDPNLDGVAHEHNEEQGPYGYSETCVPTAEETTDIERIKKDFKDGKISQGFCEALIKDRLSWSPGNQQVVGDVYGETVKKLLEAKNKEAQELIGEINKIKVGYWRDKASIARWQKKGRLTAQQREYYDNIIDKRFKETSNVVIEAINKSLGSSEPTINNNSVPAGIQEQPSSSSNGAVEAIVQQTTATPTPMAGTIPGCGGLSGTQSQGLNSPLPCFPVLPLMPDKPTGFDPVPEEQKDSLSKGCTGIPIQESQHEEVIGFADTPVEQAETNSFVDNGKPAEPEKGRHDGPKARNWNEYFTTHPVGIEHKDHFRNTEKQNPKDGSPIWKVISDVPGSEMFKEGNLFAPDRTHNGDHFEVWNKRGKWIGVANLDGSKNHQKTNAVQDKNERRLPW